MSSRKQDLWTDEKARQVIRKDDNWMELSEVKDCFVIQTGWDGRPMMNYFIEYAERIMPSIKIRECIKENKLNEIIRIIRK